MKNFSLDREQIEVVDDVVAEILHSVAAVAYGDPRLPRDHRNLGRYLEKTN
jgi:hypothetical protein